MSDQDLKSCSPASELPDMTQDPLLHVDITPNAELPLRILRAYRVNCDVRWTSNTDGSDEGLNPVYKAMNEHCAQRAEILDEAIGLLSKALTMDRLAETRWSGTVNPFPGEGHEGSAALSELLKKDQDRTV